MPLNEVILVPEERYSLFGQYNLVHMESLCEGATREIGLCRVGHSHYGDAQYTD